MQSIKTKNFLYKFQIWLDSFLFFLDLLKNSIILRYASTKIFDKDGERRTKIKILSDRK
jgi:hypothetical protein